MPRRKPAPPPEEIITPDSSPLTEQIGVDADFSTEGIKPPEQKSGARRLGDRLRSALLGGSDGEDDQADTPKATVSKKKQDEIAAQLMLFLAIILTMLSDSFFGRFAPEYASVGPQQDEAKAMTLPVARMIARRIKAATGKVTDDQLDALLLLTAITVYADRARDTAREITISLRERENNAVDATPNVISHRRAYSTQTAHDAANQGAGVYAATQQQNTSPAKNPSRSDAQQNGAVDSSATRGNVDLMGEMLRADAEGRRRRGLI